MILVFLEGPDSFTVHNEALERFLCSRIHKLYWLIPDPKALRTWVNRRSNTKAGLSLLPQENSVKQKRFACTILSGHYNHTNLVILDPHKKFSGLLSDFKSASWVVFDQSNGPATFAQLFLYLFFWLYHLNFLLFCV